MRRSVFPAVILSTLVLLSATAFAGSGQLLTFQGLGDLQPVGSFYDGGGLTSTPNYGVTFSSNFFGLRSFANGGSGQFAGTPNGMPAIFMNGTVGSTVMGTMNVVPGFSGGINFFFTAGFQPGQNETVQIWSGSNGTGTVLATISLSNNNGSCTTPSYCSWSSIGAAFSGTAHSVTFTGPADQLGITEITLGSSTTAIPEPSSIYLLGTGLTALSLRKGAIRRLLRI
jgi:hypothetical protein